MTGSISSRTLVPIGQAISLLVACLLGYIWLDARFDGVETRLTAIEQSMVSNIDDRWRAQDQKVWSQELQIANNQTLIVPDPYLTLRREPDHGDSR
jgi:hypothetical protein